MKATYGTLRQLGYELISSEAVAINELIKNAIDAEATEIKIVFSQDSVALIDNGTGIEHDTMKAIGTYISRSEKTGKTGQHGDKGLGRLSTQRIGNELVITTWNRKNARCQTIDWSILEKNRDMDISKFNPTMRDIKRDSINLQHLTGTMVQINSLINNWTQGDVEDFITNNYKKFFNVFEKIIPIRLKFYYGESQLKIPTFPIDLMKYAHATFDMEYISNKKEIKYELITNEEKEHRVNDRVEISFDKIKDYFTHIRKGEEENSRLGKILKNSLKCNWKKFDDSKLHDVGDFHIKLYWINRQKFKNKFENKNKNSQMTSLQAVEKINEWNTVGLYRDKIMVYPYGIESSDWLAFDASGLSRQGYKFNRQQLIGAVTISKNKNKNLIDTTNRQELIHNDEYEIFITLCYFFINCYFFDTVTNYQKENKKKKDNKNNIPEITRLLNEFKKIQCVIDILPCKILEEVSKLDANKFKTIFVASLRTLLEACLKYELRQKYNEDALNDWRQKHNGKYEYPSTVGDMKKILEKNSKLKSPLSSLSKDTLQFLSNVVHGNNIVSIPKAKEMLEETVEIIKVIASGNGKP